jgi:thioredoxin-dependent peroxiredoxin
MALVKNSIAPLFKINDVYGREIDLSTYSDKKVLIGFFRHAGCPFCNLRVHTLSKAHEELKSKGLEMIFFFESKDQVILRSSFHRGVSPIPIISDPEKKWYDTYGLESSGVKSAISHVTSLIPSVIKAKSLGLPVHSMTDGESIKTMPAEFVLDKGLLIKRVHYSERLNDRMDVEDIKAFAADSNVFN